MSNHTRAWASLALAVALAVACGDPTGSPPPQETPTITASVLTAGGEGRLQGTHLDQLAGASITVDGTPVAPSVTTGTEIRFPMPPTGTCEVDGRAVRIGAGQLQHTGKLIVPGVLTLEPGESRLLRREDLAATCLQVPAGNRRYVLTALNASLTPAAAPDVLMTVRTWAGGEAGATASSHVNASPAAPREIVPPRSASAATGPHRYVDQPVPYDPRYATAAVGDTLPWIDWWGPTYPNCAGAREQIPTIRIVIAAVSASGQAVIAYDARSTQSAAWTSGPVRARLGRMAEMMDRWAVRAVREVMSPGYVPLGGAGGRWFHVFRPDVAGWSVDNNDAPQTACRFSSEVPSTVGPDSPPTNDAQPEYLAGLAIHEYGHHAELVDRLRRWGSYTPPNRVSTTWGGLGEAWAQTVQETAARLASMQPTAARYTPLEVPVSNVPYTDFYLNGYGENPAQSLWGATGGPARPGFYDQGPRFLMYLRERWGDAAIGSTPARFFGAAQDLPDYGVQSLAALVGLTAESALDQWSLAEATDDLVDPGAAARHGLPQIMSWVPHDAGPLPSVMVPRTTNRSWTLAVGRGNYAALYLFADGTDADQGVSISFANVSNVPAVTRITRLR